MTEEKTFPTNSSVHQPINQTSVTIFFLVLLRKITEGVFHSERIVVCLLPESFKTPIEGISPEESASRLLQPRDPKIIDDVTFFYEQMLNLFASVLSVLLGDTCGILHKTYIIRGMTVEGNAHWRIITLACCFQCKPLILHSIKIPCGQLCILTLGLLSCFPTLTHFYTLEKVHKN